VANYSPAVLAAEPGAEPEWRTLLRLAAVVSGMGPMADLDTFDDLVFATLVDRAVADPASVIFGRDAAEIISATDGGCGPERMLDHLVRVGPYGEGYGRDSEGLSLERLRRHPHGIDLGPLEPRFPEVLATPSRQVELAPDAIIADLARLDDAAAPPDGGMVLIGRRHLRSNNSWMHNVEVLVKGRERCTLLINPTDADRLGLAAADTARVTSEAGSVAAPIEVTDEIMPGVVSLPHGWGHDLPGVELAVASRRPGVNSNVLTGDEIDPLSGNAVLNGIPVEVRRV
jgi:anaerobic selenocysteine-containing dehydrogenase